MAGEEAVGEHRPGAVWQTFTEVLARQPRHPQDQADGVEGHGGQKEPNGHVKACRRCYRVMDECVSLYMIQDIFRKT